MLFVAQIVCIGVMFDYAVVLLLLSFLSAFTCSLINNVMSKVLQSKTTFLEPNYKQNITIDMKCCELSFRAIFFKTHEALFPVDRKIKIPKKDH